MKKVLKGIALIVIVAVMSCEIPQSITIKGNPGLYIPFGRLSSFFDEGESIGDYVSPAKIREMMGDTGSGGMSLYDYRGPDVASDVQAFLIHYPITEMTLDLSKYINEAMENADTDFSFTIPDLSVEYPLFAGNLDALFQQPAGIFKNGCFIIVDENGRARLSPTEGNPLFTIPLGDMAKLLKSVKGNAGAFGLELTNYNPSFENALKFKIPDLGIPDYIPGEKNGNTLVFVNDEYVEFDPQQLGDKELKIFVKFDVPCSGTIAPEVIINWKVAIIDTSEIGGVTGDYEIENILGGFLGGGAEFKDVRGYIYVGGGIGDKASMSLRLGSSPPLVDSGDLQDVNRPFFSDPFTGNIPEQSLHDYIFLNDALNATGTSTLHYEISIDEMTLESENMPEEMVIFADLVILLTLEFEVKNTGSSSTVPEGYVKLDFGDVFPEPENGKDIFMREGNDKDLFNSLNMVEIALSKIENNIFDLSVLSIQVVNTGPDTYSNMINLGDEKPYLTIDMHELPLPFSPKFEILLKKDDGQDTATLKILRSTDPVFDFFLTARAKASINETISF